jgi:aryl-alcohol dehydrogenase-like predicted oxidoreductase
MAQGILTGKFGPNHTFEKGDHRSASRLFQPELWSRVQAALDKLRPIAARNDISLGQLALAWIISQENACAIAGARSADQVRQNAAAGDIVLSEEDMKDMDVIGSGVTDHLDDNPVMWEF